MSQGPLLRPSDSQYSGYIPTPREFIFSVAVIIRPSSVSVVRGAPSIHIVPPRRRHGRVSDTTGLDIGSWHKLIIVAFAHNMDASSCHHAPCMPGLLHVTPEFWDAPAHGTWKPLHKTFLYFAPMYPLAQDMSEIYARPLPRVYAMFPFAIE